MSKIDLTKKYQTKDGREVELYAIKIESGSRYPVIGALKEDGIWYPTCWTLEGNYTDSNVNLNSDLVEIPKEISLANIYKTKNNCTVKLVAIQNSCVFGIIFIEDKNGNLAEIPAIWDKTGTIISESSLGYSLNFLREKQISDLEKGELILVRNYERGPWLVRQFVNADSEAEKVRTCVDGIWDDTVEHSLAVWNHWKPLEIK